MIPFLKQVVDHYYTTGPIEDKCFIFPNRRSMAFFVKYLREDVADRSLCPYGEGKRRPLRMPLTLPVSDFFYKAHGVETEDRITLLLELYDCYRQLNPQAESLDEFISWGEIIIGDFSDVDKYMVNPSQVFTNVAEFKEMQDDYSYLTPGQKKAIDDFIGHFREGNALKANAAGDGVKARFLKIWDLLLPLYTKFNETLRSKGMAYDGMVYRSLVEKIKESSAADVFAKVFPSVDKFVFVGLNALNDSERFVLDRMNKAGIAEFCWDYSSGMVQNSRNRASSYMSRNVSELPQTWKMDTDGLPDPQFNVISVPSAVGQAKQIPGILSEIGLHGEPDCLDCAIVLPDEGLLMPVLNSVPSEIKDINVTMGYPMSSSGIWSLMEDVASMQLHLRRRGDEWLFYHKQVRSILSNGIFSKFLDDEAKAIAGKIAADAKYYIPQSDFKGSPLLELLFRPVIENPKVADSAQIDRYENYLLDFLSELIREMDERNESDFERDFAARFCSCVNILKSKILEILPVTYIKLLSQIAVSESVPFEGDPLKGLQIMGPLETRALDFRNVIILSCNEGIFPKKNVSTSFIPPELRKGFGLPTNEFKDAVLSYSFYRLIQRAETVWLVYDSRMEKMKAGEESRYIKQLEYHFRKPIRRYIAKATMSSENDDKPIPKPEDIAARMKDMTLSVSSLQNYLYCPAKFYYASICNLKAETEVAESLDAGMLGNVFHETMQALYMGEDAMNPAFSMERNDVKRAISSGSMVPMEYVTSGYIEAWMKRRDDIKARIRSLIKTSLNTIEVTGRDLVTEEVILQYVLKTLERDLENLKSKGVGRFRVIGLELPVTWTCDGYRFFGYIDRADSYDDGSVRIVDYKTGKVEDGDINISDENAGKIVDELFRPDNDKRPKIALQLFLYDKYVEDAPWTKDKNIVNVIYPAATLFTTPVEAMEKNRSEKFSTLAMAKLKDILAEISDTEIPFRRTTLSSVCGNCDFRNICGR